MCLLSWLDEVPGDRPVMIVAEGVTMYLTEEIMQALLNALTDHFPSASQAWCRKALGTWQKIRPSVTVLLRSLARHHRTH